MLCCLGLHSHGLCRGNISGKTYSIRSACQRNGRSSAKFPTICRVALGVTGLTTMFASLWTYPMLQRRTTEFQVLGRVSTAGSFAFHQKDPQRCCSLSVLVTPRLRSLCKDEGLKDWQGNVT